VILIRIAARPPARRCLVIAVLITWLPGAPAWGWGAQGHRIVGRVADELLDARTRTEVRRLAGDASLAELGLWMDEQRDRLRDAEPGSERWHYDNRPVCRSGVAVDAYCADGHCASHAYRQYLAVLRDRNAPAERRLFAFRVVVHLLADIHQPLHVADNDDRGANWVGIRVGRRSRAQSLHAAWDIDFVNRAMRGMPADAFAARLVAEHRGARARIEAGDLADWMQESYRLAHDYAYGRVPEFACGQTSRHAVKLPATYSDGAAEIVSEQLARAGIRLAAVLRAIL
jgi:hypothetical protein